MKTHVCTKCKRNRLFEPMENVISVHEIWDQHVAFIFLFSVFYIQAVMQQNVEKVKGCEYFLKALYIFDIVHQS